MTILDSIFKSTAITLPTKVHLVKAMVFPVVMYGCESWTVKKAEHRRIDAFEFLFTFCHNGGVICISQIIDISPGNLDSSLCFFQSSVSHDVLCISVK